MKITLSVAAVTVALSASATFAQQPSDATPSPAPNTTTATESMPPAQQAGPPSEDRPRSDWRRGRGDRPMVSRAARFYVQDGDVKIRIQCADDEPTKVCADLLLQMLDRLDGSSSSRGDRDRNRDRDSDRDRDRDSDD